MIVEITTGSGDLIALAAVDPRWRLDREGRSGGVQALRGGVPAPLPLTGLKFVGGLVDEGEDIVEAALRELCEEAGAGIEGLVRAAGPREVYRMTRNLEWNPEANVEVTYLHAEVAAKDADLSHLFEPADDCLAIVLVRRGQVALTSAGYVVTGKPAATFWRKAFVTIPYEGWAPTPLQEAAFRAYNALGAEDPTVGIDTASLESLDIPLFCPVDASPTDAMGPGDMATGRPLPDGAVLAHAIGKASLAAF
jgi:hypothetical protein